MTGLRCSRCIVQEYYWRRKLGELGSGEVVAYPHRLKAADVIYDGMTLCEEHLIAHLRRSVGAGQESEDVAP